MKKNILVLIGCLGISAHVNSMVLVPIFPVSDETEGRASYTYTISNAKSLVSNTFMTSEAINLQININVKSEDVGQSGHLYLVAVHDEGWYQKTAAGKWQQWNKDLDTLTPYLSQTLNKQESIIALANETLPKGEFLVFGGYQAGQSGVILFNSQPASLLVFNQGSAALHQVKNSSLLASYFAHGTVSNNARFLGGDFSPPLVSDVASTASSSASVSQTNVQENDVDEADRIKTDGEQLYVLENCEIDSANQCISAYDIQALPATNHLLQKLDVEANNSYREGLYLTQIDDKKHLIYQGDSSNYGIYDIWYSSYYWQNNQTDIKIIDVSQPQNMQVSTHITLDTAILSSRLIEGVLYLITRKNAYYAYPEILQVAVEEALSDSIVSPTIPKNQNLADLLPTISFHDGAGETPVLEATDCYIPNQVSDKPVDNTIITITAIPLSNPKAHYSSCIVGAVDTFYMSSQALYLATSRYPYLIEGNAVNFLADHSEMSTEIHKFSLAEGALEYRGSGTAPGHLGWVANKQPFRMGEYQGVLKVATSKGNTWDSSSTTRVSVMREASEGKHLEEIAFIDNLGKPGEQLFAARFIKNRGYLVTFRQTDPLYVLDFTVPEQPKTLGELEIDGFSDYLHPIGDDYLLGIGKDAVPNENPESGAFYQGVKLSLFDVSSAENLREIESIIIGKRGTESAVLYDHHALAWLPAASGEVATLAIPIQLNQELSYPHQDYSHPSANYGWTETGLYSFSINTGTSPGLELSGKLITDIPPDECKQPGNYCSFRGQNIQNDRAVIQENTLHYIHNNAVISSTIADLE